MHIAFLHLNLLLRINSQECDYQVKGSFVCLFVLFCFCFCFGCVGSSLLCMGFSLVVASGGYSSLRCVGFSLQWLLLLQSMGSRRTGFSSCGAWAQQLWLVGSREHRHQQLCLAGSRVQAQYVWRMGLVAPRHVGSSQTRAQTRVA